MKFPFLISILIFIASFEATAQKLINLNPDPNGEPWYVGILRTLTKEDLKRIEQTPKLTLPLNYQKGSLPSFIDNSLNKYFRPVFNQSNGSCGQASGVGYGFTYAINLARDQAANTIQTQYPTHYTYNFLNKGEDNGSFYFDGWEIINANGCPTVETYGGMANGLVNWMNGYDNYYKSMKNRTLEMYTIDVSTPQGLETLKAWMNDQLNGSPVGGIANFSGGVSGEFSLKWLPVGTPEEYKNVITFWGTEVNHAMTFVGYNDNIRYDFNNDGKYTNTVDIDGNGILDMRDWEYGGLIMVNSWGSSWGTYGKAYVPYKLLAEPKTNGGIGSSIVHVIKAKADYTPKAALKATISHTNRGKLRITAGVSSNLNATKPDQILQIPVFNFQGGDHYMKGGTTEGDKTIEIGLDITPLLSYVNSNQEARFFLVVEEKDQENNSNGTIGGFSIYDYTNGVSETVSTQTNVSISNNDTTYLTVNKSFGFDKVEVSTASIPDAAYGAPYNFTLSATKGTAPYSWNFIINFLESKKNAQIAATADNKLSPSDPDDGFADISLPFSFPFYDKTYTKIKVTTDGSILFGNQFEYVREFSSLSTTRAITVYGADLMLYPSDGDGIWYKSTNDSITIRWKTSKFENSPFNAEFSATLFPSGRIRFNYGNGITSSTDWVSGISMGNGISYNINSISGLATLPANSCREFEPVTFPEGLQISNAGVMTFTPKALNKTWSIKAQVTDINKISATKSFTISSKTILTFSTDTLRFSSATDPDPWLTGKDVTITNSFSQPVTINNIDWAGFGWSVGNAPMTFPYSLNSGETLTLNVKLKSNFTKSAGIVVDSMSVKTANTTYYLPISIKQSTTTTYTTTFNITNAKGPVSGALIRIENLVNPISSNSSGVASINLANGSYSYVITYNNYFTSTGTLTVNGLNQTVNIYLSAMGIDPNSKESLNVFPNPFNDRINITGTSIALVRVYNLIGNLVIEAKLTSTNQFIATGKLPNGLYIITIEDKNGVKTSLKISKN